MVLYVISSFSVLHLRHVYAIRHWFDATSDGVEGWNEEMLSDHFSPIRFSFFTRIFRGKFSLPNSFLSELWRASYSLVNLLRRSEFLNQLTQKPKFRLDVCEHKRKAKKLRKGNWKDFSCFPILLINLKLTRCKSVISIWSFLIHEKWQQ